MYQLRLFSSIRSTHQASLISRRHLLRRAAALTGLWVLGGPTSALPLAASRRRHADFYIDEFHRADDNDSTASIRRALEAARAVGGGRVVAAERQIYEITPRDTYKSRNPSGSTAQYRVCLQVPPGVTLDMRGSTLRLIGASEAVLVANTNLSGEGTRDAAFGLVHAVLDGGNILSSATSLLHLAYADHLLLRDVHIVNGTYIGGWIYNCRKSVFDKLTVDGFRGQPWLIGSPLGQANQVYDSHFGAISARRVTAIAGQSHFPGNSVVLAVSRCHIRSITAQHCDAGVKIQWPSQDVTVGTVTTVNCGDAAGNSGLKLQGELEGPVQRIRVGKVIARGQTGTGLYMDGSTECTVGVYHGVANNASGSRADVWIGGHDDRIFDLQSFECGGPGVIVRSYATDYRLDSVGVTNSNQSREVDLGPGVAIYGGSGSFGLIRCISSQHPSKLSRGVDVNSPDAVGQVDLLEVAGEREVAFKTNSSAFPRPRGVAARGSSAH